MGFTPDLANKNTVSRKPSQLLELQAAADDVRNTAIAELEAIFGPMLMPDGSRPWAPIRKVLQVTDSPRITSTQVPRPS